MGKLVTPLGVNSAGYEPLLISPPENYTLGWFDEVIKKYSGLYFLMYDPLAEIRTEDKDILDCMLATANAHMQ